MDEFIQYLRKFPTDSLIYELSKISIAMFNNRKFIYSFPITTKWHGTHSVSISPWDILNIEYLSICYGNDYRKGYLKNDLRKLSALYREYENCVFKSSKHESSEHTKPWEMLLGITTEQFIFQQRSLINSIDSFNRNYHLLFTSRFSSFHKELMIEKIFQEIFSISPNDYLSITLTVFWLCTQHPDPLSTPEHIYRKKDETVLTNDNLERFVSYYSCSYFDIRESHLQKQIFYSKPFIKTKKNNMYLSSNLYLVHRLLANGIYWVIRDYYCRSGSSKFINMFGILFEEYIKELASSYCNPTEWSKLAEGKLKSADFQFKLGDATLFVEAKSALLGLTARQQIPDENAIGQFLNKIEEAYEQLQSTVKKAKTHDDHKPIKIILLYDDFSDTGILQQCLPKIFQNDPLCFIVTIKEFEILLKLWKDDRKIAIRIILEMEDQIKIDSLNRKNLTEIFNKFSVWNKSHFTGDSDYYRSIVLGQLSKELS